MMCNDYVPHCVMCGKEINKRLYQKSGGRRKSCSKKCALEYRTVLAYERCAKKCLYCNVEFKAKSSAKTKFCSKECSIKYNKAKPRECKQCNVLFSPVRWQKTKNRFISDRANNREFCTEECRHVYVLSGRSKKCENCSVEFTPIRKDSKTHGYVPYDLPKTCSPECRNVIMFTEEYRKRVSERMSAENHPNWQGGSGRIGFRGSGWLKLAEKVRIRDNRKCVKCGKSEYENGRKLDVNHIVPFHQFTSKKEANKMTNLEALCRSCHTSTDWAWRKDNPVQLILPIYK